MEKETNHRHVDERYEECEQCKVLILFHEIVGPVAGVEVEYDQC